MVYSKIVKGKHRSVQGVSYMGLLVCDVDLCLKYVGFQPMNFN